ncbi:hypothetical protein, partial [Sphingomonas sp.]|uniref:hypothetical protein n=1 Tax=Sphingomonas sp. TaxID=28214 RepID=UPI00286D57D2
GAGDVEVGIKYRFVDITSQGLSVAIFPRVFLPTSKASIRTRVLLPVWAQKDIGKTSLFGGGGYEVNPGPGSRDFWLAGAAVTHAVSDKVTVGGEATHQSAGTDGGASRNSLGAGASRNSLGAGAIRQAARAILAARGGRAGMVRRPVELPCLRSARLELLNLFWIAADAS